MVAPEGWVGVQVVAEGRVAGRHPGGGAAHPRGPDAELQHGRLERGKASESPQWAAYDCSPASKFSLLGLHIFEAGQQMTEHRLDRR